MPAGDGLTLALCGRLLQAEDQRLIGAFAAQAAVVLDHIRLSRAAAEAAPLAEANKVRTALLAAVGHDFRTPLAAAKASVSTLLSFDIDLDADDRRELLQAADTSLDRLAALVDNLLDMSRLQAGAMSIDVQPTAVDEVVGAGPRRPRARTGDASSSTPPTTLPLVQADPGLLERVLANLGANALRYSPAETPPHLTSSRLGDRVEIRVIDRGPGIPPDDWDRVFLPFQRLGDTDNTTGVGLGLALSRGLTEAMGGSLEPEETPGGGLTMVVSLPAVTGMTAAAPGLRERDEADAMTRVLVVDDEPQLLRALTINLRARHYEVRGAATGTEALTVGRGPSARRRHPRPRPARHGRHRGDRRAPRLDRRTDPGAVGPLRQRRQGRGPRRRRRRLRDQAVRHGRAPRPPPRHDPPQRRQGGAARRRSSATPPSTSQPAE